MKYSLNATNVAWYGPANDYNTYRTVEEKDMFGQIKEWNISQYSDDAFISNRLPHTNRLHIVGNNMKGEFFLEIRNISIDDAGLYLCRIYNMRASDTVKTSLFIVSLKCKY